MGIKNLKVFLLYIAAVFLCIHNFIPHDHVQASVNKSAAHHHGDGQQHEHESQPGDDGSERGDPLELPSHQESVAKYIIKHHSEETNFAPELQFHIQSVYAISQADSITLFKLPPSGSYVPEWDYLLISSSYLRGPPSLVVS